MQKYLNSTTEVVGSQQKLKAHSVIEDMSESYIIKISAMCCNLWFIKFKKAQKHLPVIEQQSS